MDRQIIISIGREYGSGGHEIARRLSQKLGIPLLDSTLFQAATADSPELKKYDEKVKNVWFSRSISGYSNSIEENIAQKEFDFIQEKAAAGESFVVVGRCSDFILRDNPNLVSCFITSETAEKLERIETYYGVEKGKAEAAMHRKDKARAEYHDQHCKTSWGKARSYDLTIDSSRFGIDGTVELIFSAIAFAK